MKTTVFDAAVYLETEEDIAAYLTEALATGDTVLIAHAIDVVARARGKSRIDRNSDDPIAS
jgi:probable addiction module antidote protein